MCGLDKYLGAMGYPAGGIGPPPPPFFNPLSPNIVVIDNATPLGGGWGTMFRWGCLHIFAPGHSIGLFFKMAQNR